MPIFIFGFAVTKVGVPLASAAEANGMAAALKAAAFRNARRFGFMDAPSISKRAAACKIFRVRLDEGMFPYVALMKDKSWQPGPYEGVELMILHRNETTGGVVVLRKFKAGYTIPAHTHPLANEWAYILSGEWNESGIIYSVGTLFF